MLTTLAISLVQQQVAKEIAAFSLHNFLLIFKCAYLRNLHILYSLLYSFAQWGIHALLTLSSFATLSSPAVFLLTLGTCPYGRTLQTSLLLCTQKVCVLSANNTSQQIFSTPAHNAPKISITVFLNYFSIASFGSSYPISTVMSRCLSKSASNLENWNFLLLSLDDVLWKVYMGLVCAGLSASHCHFSLVCRVSLQLIVKFVGLWDHVFSRAIYNFRKT